MSERGRSFYAPSTDKIHLPDPLIGKDDGDYYKETWWNLNNLPQAPGSVLRYFKVAITGINVPWMYHGALFTTFAWHNEDNYLYSINYNHRGAPKVWYGCPGAKKAADGLEKVFKSYLSMKMRDVPDLLHHITTMFSPRLLQAAEVPVYKIVQYEGEYVVTFPRAFHGGFSLGPNIGEAVNFAPHDWISYGSEANERYRSFQRPAVFSHDRLAFTMANHLEDQTDYTSCKLLFDELVRIVDDELHQRRSLQKSGVRDVSDSINLPPNNLDRLDEASADYDDKRLCHSCKHICFLSAVGCECSHSRVSCLRHSHFMCRCPPEKQYFLIWSKEDELTSTLKRVEDHCNHLQKRNPVPHDEEGDVQEVDELTDPIAPGAQRDLYIHRNHDIQIDPIGEWSFVHAPISCDNDAMTAAAHWDVTPRDLGYSNIPALASSEIDEPPMLLQDLQYQISEAA
jgi:hypothetical protein